MEEAWEGKGGTSCIPDFCPCRHDMHNWTDLLGWIHSGVFVTGITLVS